MKKNTPTPIRLRVVNTLGLYGIVALVLDSAGNPMPKENSTIPGAVVAIKDRPFYFHALPPAVLGNSRPATMEEAAPLKVAISRRFRNTPVMFFS